MSDNDFDDGFIFGMGLGLEEAQAVEEQMEAATACGEMDDEDIDDFEDTEDEPASLCDVFNDDSCISLNRRETRKPYFEEFVDAYIRELNSDNSWDPHDDY